MTTPPVDPARVARTVLLVLLIVVLPILLTSREVARGTMSEAQRTAVALSSGLPCLAGLGASTDFATAADACAPTWWQAIAVGLVFRQAFWAGGAAATTSFATPAPSPVRPAPGSTPPRTAPAVPRDRRTEIHDTSEAVLGEADLARLEALARALDGVVTAEEVWAAAHGGHYTGRAEDLRLTDLSLTLQDSGWVAAVATTDSSVQCLAAGGVVQGQRNERPQDVICYRGRHGARVVRARQDPYLVTLARAETTAVGTDSLRIAVDVIVQRTGPGEAGVTFIDFGLSDAAGYNYSPHLLGRSPQFHGSDNLEAGVPVRGWVTIDAPGSARELMLEFTSTSLTTAGRVHLRLPLN